MIMSLKPAWATQQDHVSSKKKKHIYLAFIKCKCWLQTIKGADNTSNGKSKLKLGYQKQCFVTSELKYFKSFKCDGNSYNLIWIQTTGES